MCVHVCVWNVKVLFNNQLLAQVKAGKVNYPADWNNPYCISELVSSGIEMYSMQEKLNILLKRMIKIIKIKDNLKWPKIIKDN